MDVATLLASAGVSAVVSVVTATRIASRSERGRHIFETRRRLRETVDPVFSLARRVELGYVSPPRQPERGIDGGDYVLASKVLGIAENLPAWQRGLIHRRCRRLFGHGVADLAAVQPPRGDNIGALVGPLLAWQVRKSRDRDDPLKPEDVHGLMEHGLAEGAPKKLTRRLRRSLDRLRHGW